MIVLLAAVTFEAPVTLGTEVVVAVTDASGDPAGGETVRVVHRPGLAGEREVAIGITDGRGRVRWTPDQAGVAVVRAGEQDQPVRVDGPTPTSTVLVAALLALLGLGTLAFGLVRR